MEKMHVRRFTPSGPAHDYTVAFGREIPMVVFKSDPSWEEKARKAVESGQPVEEWDKIDELGDQGTPFG